MKRRIDSLAPVGAGVLVPMLSIDGIAEYLSVSRRTIERERSSGRFPRPDVVIGKLPRWRPETVRDWAEKGGRR